MYNELSSLLLCTKHIQTYGVYVIYRGVLEGEDTFGADIGCRFCHVDLIVHERNGLCNSG